MCGDSEMKNNKWVKIVFAADLKECDCCEDKWCPKCKSHYSECECLGPTQDGVEYKTVKGVLYGRLLSIKGRGK